MDEPEIAARVGRLEHLLDGLQRTPGATAAGAVEAVQLVAAIYGEGLARMAALSARRGDGLLEAMADDELVGHLLALHGLHPGDVAERVARALATVRPAARSHGGDVELVGIDSGTALVRLSGSCDGCAASAATMEGLVRDAVLGAVPELVAVEALAPGAAPHPAPGAGDPVPVALGARRDRRARPAGAR